MIQNKNLSIIIMNLQDYMFNICMNIVNYLPYYTVTLLCSKLRDLCRDQSFTVSKPEGELISVLPEYSKP